MIPASTQGNTSDSGEALVLGIDPGTAATGYGLVLRGRGGSVTLVECGVIRTSASAPLPTRIREIYDAIVAIIERHRPLAVSVEDVSAAGEPAGSFFASYLDGLSGSGIRARNYRISPSR